MAYDPSKDEDIYICPEIEGDGGSSILIKLARYDNGPIKLRLNRAKTYKDGKTNIGKIGAMTRDEARRVAGTITNLVAQDDYWKRG